MKRIIVNSSKFLNKKGNLVFRTKHTRLLSNGLSRNKTLINNTVVKWSNTIDNLLDSIRNNPNLKESTVKDINRFNKLITNKILLKEVLGDDLLNNKDVLITALLNKDKKVDYLVVINKEKGVLEGLISDPDNINIKAPNSLKRDIKKIKRRIGLKRIKFMPVDNRLENLYKRWGAKYSKEEGSYYFRQYE